MEKYGYRFSFGPWNIHEGGRSLRARGPASLTFAQKLPLYKELGFDAVQFHDDDAVPDLDDLTPGADPRARPRHAPPAGRPRAGRGVRGAAPVGSTR